MALTIYTDGSARQMTQVDNTFVGGYAFIIIKDNKVVGEFAKAVHPATISECETLGIMHAVKNAKEAFPGEPIQLYSDSQYALDIITGAKNAQVNKPLFEMAKEITKDVELIKVKGHGDNIFNNRCDKLAKGNMSILFDELTQKAKIQQLEQQSSQEQPLVL